MNSYAITVADRSLFGTETVIEYPDAETEVEAVKMALEENKGFEVVKTEFLWEIK